MGIRPPLSSDELSGLRLCSSNPGITLPSDFSSPISPIAQGIAALMQIMCFYLHTKI